MGLIDGISTKILKSRYTFNKEILEIYYSSIIDYETTNHEAVNIMGVNLRNEILSVLQAKNINFENFQISAIKNNYKLDDTYLNPIEDLSKFIGSNCDIFILDSCLQYTLNPQNFLLSALEICNNVICIIKNYASFKKRLHFCLNGSYNFLDIENGCFKSNILTPFSISDFIKMCDINHILIKDAFYLNKKGKISNLFGSGTFGNLYLDEVVFILNKL